LTRLMRAFTLDSTISVDLDRLLEDPKALEILIPVPISSEIAHPIKNEPLDDHDLRPEDYATLHAGAGTKPAKQSKGWDARYAKPKSDWDLLMDALVATQNEAHSNKALRAARELGKLNRRERRKAETMARKLLYTPPPRRTAINASRVAEAVISLGLESLHRHMTETPSNIAKSERSKQLEYARSTESHDGQGQAKRPRGKANKDAASGAVHGGSRT
jgi:hypothetical protein